MLTKALLHTINTLFLRKSFQSEIPFTKESNKPIGASEANEFCLQPHRMLT